MGDVSAANAANVALYDEAGNRVGTAANPLFSTVFSALVPTQYNRIELAYNNDGTLSTVVYLNGGVTVATLSLEYISGVLSSVARV